MTPDPFRRTLRLPIQLNDGEWCLQYGGPLPALKDGALADLVIESHYLEDQDEVAHLEVKKTVTLMEAGCRLMARMSLDYCDTMTGLDDQKQPEPKVNYPVAFVPICLKEALKLTLVAGKPAHLSECDCELPSIMLEAKSVNHAYTLASRHYEKRRRSSGGNVFNCVYYWDDAGVRRPLKELRTKHEAEFESGLARNQGRPQNQ
jgi:hypothetical protein